MMYFGAVAVILESSFVDFKDGGDAVSFLDRDRERKIWMGNEGWFDLSKVLPEMYQETSCPFGMSEPVVSYCYLSTLGLRCTNLGTGCRKSN